GLNKPSIEEIAHARNAIFRPSIDGDAEGPLSRPAAAVGSDALNGDQTEGIF
ncbi:hypothetical protein M9458_041021, partial [Cirrhinus mrigala]